MKITPLLLLGILLTLVQSCEKEDMRPVVADELEGQYKLASLEWDGPEVDINGDGIASHDIEVEFNTRVREHLYANVHFNQYSWRNHSIVIRLPIAMPEYLCQLTDYDYNNCTQRGSGTSFSVSKKGVVSFEKGHGLLPEYTNNNDPYSLLSGLEIVDYEGNCIRFKADCRVFDLATKTFKTGTYNGTFYLDDFLY